MNNSRELTDLDDIRLIYRGNKIMNNLFHRGVFSVKGFSENESSSKGAYRFLQNSRVSEEDLVSNLVSNCKASVKNKTVLVCIQDTTEINLSSHSKRIKKDELIGTTNAKNDKGLGFFVHPSLVLDGHTGLPCGYSDIRIWNRSLDFKDKFTRNYSSLPIEEKESFKWIESSKKTKKNLGELVDQIVIVQDREGDIYEQFATIPDVGTQLLIRAKSNRTLADKTKLFDCLKNESVKGEYTITVEASSGKRKKREAKIQIKFKKVALKKTLGTKNSPENLEVYYIEAEEVNYTGKDKIHWRLLTTIEISDYTEAQLCLEWYSWRWIIEEVFKIVKKEGYNVESSELEHPASIRKLTILVLEVVIKLFLMRIAYSEPEERIAKEIPIETCFDKQEQEYLELEIQSLEGKTQKQKNPFTEKTLGRYVWVIARLGGWKGYEWKRRPGITTLQLGYSRFKERFEGWKIARIVSTR